MSLSLVGIAVTSIINLRNKTEDMVWYYHPNFDAPFLLRQRHIPEDAIGTSTKDGRDIYAHPSLIIN